MSSEGENPHPQPDMVAATANLLMFMPERMGWAERFAKFFEPTYSLSDLQKRNVSGVANHLRKSIVLYRLLHRLRPNLEIDQNELRTRGFTAAHNANEFSAVFESSILELYSAVDCAAKTVIAIYAKRAKKLGESTRGLFVKFEAIEGEFPEELKAILRSVDWYHDLRVVRDELTHREIGRCSLDHRTGLVNYLLSGLQHEGKPLHIEDIFGWYERKFEQVNRFTGALFHFLFSTLGPGDVTTICGMTRGKMLIRFVDPSKPLNFDNGRCGARAWIDKPEGPDCPFNQWCGAYWGRPIQPEIPPIPELGINPGE